MALRLVFIISLIGACADAFFARSNLNSRFVSKASLMAQRDDFSLSFTMPQKGITEYGTAEMKFPPLLEESETVIVLRWREIL